MIRMKAAGILIILLSYFLALNTANARAAVPLVNPGLSEWGCKLSLSKVKQGIDSGLIARGWTPSNSKPGYVQGKILVRGKHTLVVDINYTETSFDIKYQTSINLKHKIDNGVEKIHPNANSWMDNIKRDIGNVLRHMCNQ